MRAGGVLAAILLLTLASCGGQGSTPSDRAHAIEAQVWSPYCPGRLLSDCTTVQARELRAEIERRVEAGQPPEQVLEWIRSDFGEAAVARPRAGAAGAVLWLVPLLVLAAGGFIVARLIRRSAHQTSPDT